MNKKETFLPNVGIVMPTFNRPDFVIRQLNYYASLESPHTVYIGDSSKPLEAERIKKRVSELNGRLNVVYNYCPPGDVAKCVIQTLTLVKEKYACLLGDDDYQVPNTLTLCAEFLENNPDYALAMGYQITFKIRGNGACGELLEVHDYLRRSMEAETGSLRLYDLLGHIAPLINCVSGTDNLLRFHKESYPAKDEFFSTDLGPSSLLIIAGKYKVINRIGFVRQIHDSHYITADIFDWLIKENWHQQYKLYQQNIVQALIEKDQLNRKEAETNFKKAFWQLLAILIPRLHGDFMRSFETVPLPKISLRFKIASKFPFLKHWYRRLIRPLYNQKIQLHYEVVQPSSPYYSDFAPIIKSFSKNI